MNFATPHGWGREHGAASDLSPCPARASDGRVPLSWGQLAIVAPLFLCLLGLTAPAWALEPPAYRGYVNDYAQMLHPGSAQEIEQALRAFAETDSTQIAVLTLASLEGDDLEAFSIRTVEKWGVGQRGRDNGVLLLVVKNDRKIRIEVGRGLEGVLTDLAAGRITDNIIRPLFKAGQFDQGIRDGVTAIIKACRGEFTAAARRPARAGRSQEPSPALSYLFLSLFVISFLGRASRPLGVVAGAILLPLAVLLGGPAVGIFFLLLLIPIGAVAGLLVPFVLGNMLMGGSRIALGGGSYTSGGGFGGFGGGSFGGGGASGNW